MSRFINPFTDVGFKLIFGREVSKDLLLDFLNQLLDGEKTLCSLKFSNKEQTPENILDRTAIFDIYCETTEGEKIIVEMQNQKQLHFRERSLYYMSRAISGQGEKGSDWKYDIHAVYGVFFMNFIINEHQESYRTDVALTDLSTHHLFTDKMRMYYLEMPKFTKEPSECENDFERWIYVLKNMENLKRMPFAAQNAVFRKLSQIAEVGALSKEERMKYDESIKQYRDHLAIQAAIEEDRRNARREGREQGLEQGLEQGREQGRKQGREQGRAEGLIRGRKEMLIQTIGYLRESGMTDIAIAKTLHLDLSFVSSIQNP